MNEFLNAALVPVIIGVVSVFKSAGMPSRFAPLASLALGIGGVFLLPHDVALGVTILIGIGSGLSASGLYSGAKAMVAPSEPEI